MCRQLWCVLSCAALCMGASVLVTHHIGHSSDTSARETGLIDASTPGASLSGRAHSIELASIRSMPARPVRAGKSPPGSSFEQIIGDMEPIFQALPDLPRTDWHKLRYYCPGDFNKDNRVDADDLLVFLEAWADTAHPLAPWADINTDGMLDVYDVFQFLDILSADACDPNALRERRDIIC